jgi:hypothetical protein
LGIFLKNPLEIATDSAGKVAGKRTWRTGSPLRFNGSRVRVARVSHTYGSRARRKPLLGPPDFNSGHRTRRIGPPEGSGSAHGSTNRPSFLSRVWRVVGHRLLRPAVNLRLWLCRRRPSTTHR